MSATQAAVATAPKITGKEVTTHSIKQVGTGLHIGITALADVVKYGTARLVNAIDKTQSVQEVADEIQQRTDIKLEKFRNGLSGYKSQNIK